MEQQRKIEHAQYLISRWGASDEAPAEACPISGGQSTLPAAAPYPATPNQVDQLWAPGTVTEGVPNAWSFSTTGVQQQCRWPYTAAQAPKEATQRISTAASTRTSGRGNGNIQTKAPGKLGQKQGEGGRRAARRWSPKEFLPDDKNLDTPTSPAM